MSKVSIKLVRSTIGRPDKQLRIVKSLGLGFLNASKEVEYTPSLKGQLDKVSHLVEVNKL